MKVAEFEPEENMGIFGPGGEVEEDGLNVSHVMPCGELLSFAQCTLSPALTVTGAVERKAHRRGWIVYDGSCDCAWY